MGLPGGRVGMGCSVVAGDMGLGFCDFTEDSLGGRAFIKNIPLQHKFIVGNHDSRKLSHAHSNCLGDFGYNEPSGIFFLSGGFSIDFKWRTKDVTWWEDEELSSKQLYEAIELYKKIKPRILVAHECPTEIKFQVATNAGKLKICSRTELALQAMLNEHRPEFCIFGHHHNRIEEEIDGTKFIGLGSVHHGKYKKCIYEIPGVNWG